MYLLLVVVLFLILIRFCVQVVDFVEVMVDLSYDEWVIYILDLLDLTLLANLVLIVAFSGYENFISKLEVAENHVDRPSWMGRLDFSGLKIKIIASVVAITVIELLQDFLNAAQVSPEVEFWRIALHMTFVVTGVIFAYMEMLNQKRYKLEDEINDSD